MGTDLLINDICAAMTVYAFDFDGTLTTRDTLIEFIRYAKGNACTFLGFALHAPILVLMKLHLYPNWKAKQRIFTWFFKGMTIERFDQTCQSFAKERQDLLRKDGQDIIRRATEHGKVFIVSASIDNWVRPFFANYTQNIDISCTRIDVRDGKLTGKFLTKNCYGTEKVKRLKHHYPFRESYRLVAMGDSKGDGALIEEADTAYFRQRNGSLKRLKGEKDDVVEHLI